MNNLEQEEAMKRDISRGEQEAASTLNFTFTVCAILYLGKAPALSL
jgi:hypothetical protein